MKKILLTFFAAILLVGIHSANAFVPCSPNQGCTGTNQVPVYGQVMVGNYAGTYTLTATSSLGIGGSGGAQYFTVTGVSLNQNTGSQVQIGNLLATSTASSNIANFGGILDASQFSGADIFAQANSAYAWAVTNGFKSVTIKIPAGNYTASTGFVCGTNGFRCVLEGTAGGGTTVNYTGTGAATTFNFGIQGTGIDHQSGCGLRDITLIGNNQSTSSPQIGELVGGTNGDDCSDDQNVTIESFGYGEQITANAYHYASIGEVLRNNGQNLHVNAASNSGEDLEWVNLMAVDGANHDQSDCIWFDNSATENTLFVGGMQDDCEAHYLQANNITEIGVSHENVGYTAWNQTPYVLLDNNLATNYSVNGSTFFNDGGSTQSPSTFIQYGANVTLNGVIVRQFGGFTVTNFATPTGSGRVTWSGLNNVSNAAFTNVVSGIPYSTNGSTGSTTLDGIFNLPLLSTGCLNVNSIGVVGSQTCSSGSSGTGNVSTSTSESAGQVAFWTSNSGTPALLGEEATGTITCSGCAAAFPTGSYDLGNSLVLSAGNLFSTTSASYWGSQQGYDSFPYPYGNSSFLGAAQFPLSSTSTIAYNSGGMVISSSTNPISHLGGTATEGQWPVVINNPNSTNGFSTGIGFNVSSAPSSAGAVDGFGVIGGGLGFIRQGNNSYGDLFFATTPAGGANTERVRIASTGNVGIGSTTPGTLLSLGNTGANTINISPTATSTFGSGINITTGCFAIATVCVGGGGGSGTVTNIATTWPIIGGPITNTGTLTFGGLGTSTNLTIGQVPYVTGVNTFGQEATGTVTCTGTASCGAGSYVLGNNLTINGSAAAYSFTPSTFGVTAVSATSTNINDSQGFSSTASSTLFQLTTITATSTNATSTNDLYVGNQAVINNALTLVPASQLIGTGPFKIVDSSGRGFEIRQDANDNWAFDNNYGGVWATAMTLNRQFGYLGIGSTSPAYPLSVEGISSLGNSARAGSFTATTTTASQFPYASTTMVTAVTASTTNLYLNGLGTPAGSFIAVDATGKVIATTSPSGAASVASVSNSDSTLTISPTTGSVVASVNLNNNNLWTAASTTFQGTTTVAYAANFITGISGIGSSFKNGRYISLATTSLAAGTSTLYTVPPGKKLYVMSSNTFHNSGGSTIIATTSVTIGGNTNITSVFSITSGSFLSNGAMTFPILNPGDTLNLATSQTGESVYMNGILFDSDMPFSSVILTSLGTGDNTWYTVPSGKTAYVVSTDFTQQTNSSGSSIIGQILNNSGTTITALHANYVPSGSSPSSVNQLSANFNVNSNTSGRSITIINSPVLVMNSGDSLNLNSSNTIAASSNFILWVNVMVQ